MARAGRPALTPLLLKSGQFDRYWSFMTPPRPECTSAELEKRQVWPNGDISGTATGSAGKVTEQPSLQSAQGQISSLSWKIIVLF
jgi:hypothetical protein